MDCPWNSLGQNTGVGSPSLLQGIFLTQELNQGLLHCRRILYQQSYQAPVEYYSAIKRNAFESVLMMLMTLEPIIHSKVSQKEKDKYHILTHIYGI